VQLTCAALSDSGTLGFFQQLIAVPPLAKAEDKAAA
jgi:hypothetical protein